MKYILYLLWFIIILFFAAPYLLLLIITAIISWKQKPLEIGEQVYNDIWNFLFSKEE